MNNSTTVKNRICFLDELRGLAVIAMVLYHILYSMSFIFALEFSYPAMRAVIPYEPAIPITFISICGICCSFSKSNLKRGVILLGISFGITLVTCIIMPEQAILFGILHFLSIALIIYALLQKPISHIPPFAGLCICLALFIICFNIPKGYIGFEPFYCIQLPKQLYQLYALSFIGFPSSDFISSDYFPIFPYIFLFFGGAFAGRILKLKGVPRWMYKKLCPPLDFIGRHALIIYIVHQPVIIGVLYMCHSVFNIF